MNKLTFEAVPKFNSSNGPIVTLLPFCHLCSTAATPPLYFGGIKYHFTSYNSFSIWLHWKSNVYIRSRYQKRQILFHFLSNAHHRDPWHESFREINTLCNQIEYIDLPLPWRHSPGNIISEIENKCKEQIHTLIGIHSILCNDI